MTRRPDAAAGQLVENCKGFVPGQLREVTDRGGTEDVTRGEVETRGPEHRRQSDGRDRVAAEGEERTGHRDLFDAEDCGDDAAPLIWDAERRFQLQCEIDAAFFHLYDISRENAAYILDTFNLVRDEEKRVVLETYDALAAAVASGKPYVSPLGPPRRAK